MSTLLTVLWQVVQVAWALVALLLAVAVLTCIVTGVMRAVQESRGKQ